MLVFHVQLFSQSSSRNVDSDELAELTRAFRAQLCPLGYKAVKIHWTRKGPDFAVLEKGVPTLAVARRERRLLDRVLFGD
jgi:hypothetical protein